MNLNKLNKDQLINKIQEQENIITPKSYGTQIFMALKSLIIGINGLILKFTFITLIIKFFKKYKFIRKILLFFNWIILSLFGISVLDIYDTNLVSYSIEWIRSTHLYKILIELFENNSENIEKVEAHKPIIEKIQENKVDSSKSISMRSDYQRDRKIDTETWGTFERSVRKTSEKIEDNPWINKEEIINYKNFGILISLIVLGSLGWFFWDDNKPLLSLNYFRKRKPDTSENIENNSTKFLDYEEEYSNYFKILETNEEIYDLETIKSSPSVVNYSDVEIEKWNESPTTPKAGPSKLPSKEVLMIPISKE